MNAPSTVHARRTPGTSASSSRSACATIVYLHGFNSAPQTAKGQMLLHAASAHSPPIAFHLPKLPVSPAAAITAIESLVKGLDLTEGALTFVGSSLGGFYATAMAERFDARAVVINPAIRPYAALEHFLGPQQNLYTGERYTLTRQHLDEMQALRVARLSRPERYLLLVRSGDELLDWREAVRYYSGAWQYVGGGGDHGWSDFGPMIDTVLRFAMHEVAAPPCDESLRVPR